MNVFISQPMRGRKQTEILAERENIFKRYKDEYPSAVLLDSVISPELQAYAERHSGYRSPRVWLLGESLQKLAEADVMILAKGWEGYPGCRIEQKVATYYDISLIYDK